MMAPGRAPAAAGFTLIELLVAMAISSMIVATAVTLQRVVLQAGDTVKSGQRAWVAEQFLRAQSYALDLELTKRFALVRTDAESYSFVTRRSAQFGDGGPPVFVTYRFDDARGALAYDEVAMPGWWLSSPGDYRFSAEGLGEQRGAGVWHGVLFNNVSAVHFSYWDKDRGQWSEALHVQTAPPPAVKIELQGAQPREIVLENGVSSLFSFSGSSPDAQ
jgi:type II secretion system protein J